MEPNLQIFEAPRRTIYCIIPLRRSVMSTAKRGCCRSLRSCVQSYLRVRPCGGDSRLGLRKKICLYAYIG